MKLPHVRRVFRRLASIVPRAPRNPDDPDGLDLELVRSIAPTVDGWARTWFDLEVRGLENVPEGPALLVGNHNSGAMFLEAIGLGARWYLHSDDDSQAWHGLAHDNIIGLPVVGPLLHRVGAITAGHESAARAFSRGRKVVVFPGGNREAFRPWRDRYRVAFGDRRGFVKLALEHGVPIVPVVFVGGHSGLFIVSDNQRLAKVLRADRWLRSDTWPLMVALPWGVALAPMFHLPLPVGCITRVLEPIPVDPWLDRRDDPAAWDEVHALVTQRMQAAMDALVAERKQRPWPLRRRAQTS
ncbi:MAG: lysophospholipid acyltransferase family protein [Myxococcota bacterium]